jgi:hypothetical protein
MKPEYEPKLDLVLGPELTAGLNRLYGHFPRPKPGRFIDFDIQIGKRRKEIADGVQKARIKLGLDHFDRLSLPEEERPDIISVVRNNLLGLIDNDVLISEMFPQEGNANKRHMKIKTDPLWKHIFPLLTARETGVVGTALNSLRKHYLQLHTDNVKGSSGINAQAEEDLGQNGSTSFETMCDLRKISLREWNLITGFGPTTANFIFEAVKKIEIPAE